jgi:hypothetical protein
LLRIVRKRISDLANAVLCGSALKITQHGIEKPGKPGVEVRLAEGGNEANALFSLRDDAGLPQDAVMMRLR